MAAPGSRPPSLPDEAVFAPAAPFSRAHVPRPRRRWRPRRRPARSMPPRRPCCRWSRRRRSGRRAGQPRGGVGGKCSTQVAGSFPARESDLRRGFTTAAQALCGEPQVEQTRHDTRDFMRLVETSFDETGRVQRHGYDQCRAAPGISRPSQCLRDHPRAEDPGIGERTFVLECLHQLRHRELVGPGG